MCESKRKCSAITNWAALVIRYAIATWLFHILLSNPSIGVEANPDAKRLYDDLLSHYNRLIRPVSNNSQVVTVRLGLHLTQLIDLDLKNQILTTNVWVEHEWMDAKLTWDPEEYGGVKELMVPSDHIWLPDIVLYNNADGEYVVTTMTKASLYYDGIVKWNPPAIFKSYCEIDVRYFPFDTQTCFMKFGSWSYSGLQMDLKHIHSSENLVEIGMNLKDYYPSGEWDILDVPAERHARFYECCPNEFYADIFFNITLRRKTLFYTVNLIIPCVGISCLSVLTFYLPADSGEKVALCITTLLSQTMFFLLMSEIIPSTSLAMPLLGKYLLFTMCLVGLSVLITIVILNVRYRKPSTHKMSPWVRRFFIQQLPKMLLMRVPNQSNGNEADPDSQPTTDMPPAPSALHRDDDDNDIDLNSFEVNTISGQHRRLEQHGGRLGPSGQIFQSKSHHLHQHGSRLGLASSGSARSLSSATRRWSRAESPLHYGSQLLCEIINHNAAQHKQQYQEQERQRRYEEERHRYGQSRKSQHCRRHEGDHCYANQEERYQHEQLQQQQQQQHQQLLLTRLPPPPLTPSPVISTITPASMPPPSVFSPATPPLPFLIQPLSSYPSMVGTPGGTSLRQHSISCSSSGSSDGAGFPIGRSGISSAAATGSKYKTNKSKIAGAMALPMSDIGYDGDSGCSRPSSPMDEVGLAASVNNLRHRRPNRVVKRFPLELQKAIRDVQFIQNHMKREDEYDEEDNDWGFIAMVLDRFFLWVFTVASLCGTISILFTAPALYDDSSPINLKYLGEMGFY